MLGLAMIGKISMKLVPGTFCQTLASIFVVSLRTTPDAHPPGVRPHGLMSMNEVKPARFKTL